MVLRTWIKSFTFGFEIVLPLVMLLTLVLWFSPLMTDGTWYGNWEVLFLLFIVEVVFNYCQTHCWSVQLLASSSKNVTASMVSEVERTFKVRESFDAAFPSLGSTSTILLSILGGACSMESNHIYFEDKKIWLLQ